MKANSLHTLHTPLGKRSLYDSVCFCNRCGMCASVCPAYQICPQESNSPRGRNQALRLLLERKIKPAHARQQLLPLVTSCTLCGKCTHVCPGQIPTPQHVLELRRRLQTNLLPGTLFYLLRLRGTFPRLFALTAQAGVLLYRVGILQSFSFGWLKHVFEILPRRLAKPFKAPFQTRPTLIYLPSLEAQFLLPDLARRTFHIASKKHRVTVWNNTATGLFEYVYGDLQRARYQLRSLITRYQQTAKGKLPLLTDSIDVYHFLKQAPQLFEGFSSWQQKAENLAAHVRFVTDFFPKKPKIPADLKKPALLMPAALFTQDSSACTDATQILQTLFKKNFVKCEYKQDCIVPAGIGFIKGSRAHAYHLQAVRTVAQHQAQTVVVLSGLTGLELAFALRQFYPAARVCHIAELNG